jgi:tungstate transport system substrate-binding protein
MWLYKGKLFLKELGLWALIVFLSFSLSFAFPRRVRLATTTSLENTGLLYQLLPPFEQKFNIKVDILAVGSGKALKLAQQGDVDGVFVHAPRAEQEFIRASFGVNRREVMYNYFVIVGPPNDPARIRGCEVLEALKRISTTKSNFISRGDDSGTHQKEKELWRLAQVTPQGKWYFEAGQGMAPTLCLADEKRAYCLVDKATFLTYRKKIELILLCEKPLTLLKNPYSIIAVNPNRYPEVNYIYLMALIGWLTSPKAQKIIKNFRKDNLPLFYPSTSSFK